jgi:acetyl-CoA carboxylase biotin carboxylase subunit
MQRRHQKVIEESPSPLVDDALRARMGETAVRIGRLAGYFNAGTVEFLVDRDRNFYFLEMNARLQVEHPITETVVGLDLVKEQLRIAAGEELRWRQEDVRLRGAAIECRIYAEDPENNFFPSPGRIERLQPPRGPWIRSDSGVYEGWTVPLEYDPLLAKLVAWGADREEAVARMRRALREYEVLGIKTNIPFFRRVFEHPDYLAGNFDTGWIDRALAGGLMRAEEPDAETERVAAIAALLASRHGARTASAPANSSGRSAWKLAGREALLDRWPKRS